MATVSAIFKDIVAHRKIIQYLQLIDFGEIVLAELW